MSKLLDYLNLLDKDAAAREAFAKNPRDAMKAFGLNEEEQKALLSGDKAAVAKLVGVNVSALPAFQTIVTDYKPD